MELKTSQPTKMRSRLSITRSKLDLDEKENPKPRMLYHTREAYIQPSNERTLKMKMKKEEELERIKRQKELERKAEMEQKMKMLEMNEKVRKKEEEEELRRYRRKIREEEELEELEALVG